MKSVCVRLPDALVEGMDRLVKEGLYGNRSGVIRTALRDLLKDEAWFELKPHTEKH